MYRPVEPAQRSKLAKESIVKSFKFTPYSDLRTVSNCIVLILSLYKIFSVSTLVTFVPEKVDTVFLIFESITEIMFLIDFLLWLLVAFLATSEDYQMLENPRQALLRRSNDKRFLVFDFIRKVVTKCSPLSSKRAKSK